MRVPRAGLGGDGLSGGDGRGGFMGLRGRCPGRARRGPAGAQQHGNTLPSGPVDVPQSGTNSRKCLIDHTRARRDGRAAALGDVRPAAAAAAERAGRGPDQLRRPTARSPGPPR